MQLGRQHWGGRELQKSARCVCRKNVAGVIRSTEQPDWDAQSARVTAEVQIFVGEGILVVPATTVRLGSSRRSFYRRVVAVTQ